VTPSQPALSPEDLDCLLDAARQAGREILEVYETDFGVERKEDASPLTEADLRAHRVITQRLAERFPEIPVISEENSESEPYAVRRNWKRFWLVDPLDGTKEFIKRNGQFTVNIGLIEGRTPVAGVVFAPCLGLFYYTLPGVGAFRREEGGEPAQLRGPAADAGAGRLVIAGSLSHPTPEMDAFVAEQRRKFAEVEFVAMGSSLKICLVAEGKAHIYPRFGPTMEWDTAAAHAVALAAGCRILNEPGGDELLYNKEDLRNGWFVVTGAREPFSGAQNADPAVGER